MVAKKYLQVTLRVYEEEVQRLEVIAKAMSGPGIEAAPIDAVRYVLTHGYESAEKKLGITRAKPAGPPKKGIK